MKAIIWTKYGPPDVLQLEEIEKPVPKKNEILVRIHATTVTTGDCEMRAMKIPFLFKIFMRMYIGLRKPKRIKILGMEFAGEVEEIGKDVKKFKIGDQVFAAPGFINLGTYTEYISLPEEPKEGVISKKPSSTTYEEAAAVPMGGLEALNLVKKGHVNVGMKVLINGAGGTIGTFAVQLAKYYGAEVAAVDTSPKLPMLSSIGADYVLDYVKNDFTKNSKKYDVIIDVVGKKSISELKRALKNDGMIVLANPKILHVFRSKFLSRNVKTATNNSKVEDLLLLKQLLEEGKIKSVVDRIFSLEDTIEAHKYVETGNKIGHVIIKI